MFTKGPWIIRKLPGMLTTTIENPTINLPGGIATAWNTYEINKSMDENGDPIPDPIQDANARLIAAAPEMFELLQDKLAVIENTPYAYNDWAKSVKELIAKIEGKS